MIKKRKRKKNGVTPPARIDFDPYELKRNVLIEKTQTFKGDDKALVDAVTEFDKKVNGEIPWGNGEQETYKKLIQTFNHYNKLEKELRGDHKDEEEVKINISKILAYCDFYVNGKDNYTYAFAGPNSDHYTKDYLSQVSIDVDKLNTDNIYASALHKLFTNIEHFEPFIRSHKNTSNSDYRSAAGGDIVGHYAKLGNTSLGRIFYFRSENDVPTIDLLGRDTYDNNQQLRKVLNMPEIKRFYQGVSLQNNYR